MVYSCRVCEGERGRERGGAYSCSVGGGGCPVG